MTRTLRAARPAERSAALALLYRGLTPDDCERRTATALHMISRGEVEPEGLLVAREDRALRGVLLAVPLAGACALFYPPEVVPSDPDLEDLLIRHACAWLSGRGMRIAQSVAAEAEVGRYAPLVRHGFVPLGRMWYLHHPLDRREPPVSRPPFRLIPGHQIQPRFGRALLASYSGTLDFPELTGWRTLDEVLAGHRLQTRHDPDLWWLIESEGLDAGVALIGSIPETNEWDLSYLGLVPAARGRGLGRAVLAEILHRAFDANVARVTLAVDDRNSPARRLYQRAGFIGDDFRAVFLKLGLAPGDRPVSPPEAILPSAPFS